MRYLTGDEAAETWQFFRKAAKIALQSPCFRSRCGSVIVKDGKIIATGFNSPPCALERCLKDDLPKDFKSDKTCCIHAECRAIDDGLQHRAQELEGARLYFIRLDEKGAMVRAGKPYCTICSKEALDKRLAEFALWHHEGICIYDTKEYNELSFQYRE